MRRDEYQAKFGFYLFIASLTSFFLAGMLAYAIITMANKSPLLTVSIFPKSLIFGTLGMFGVSFAMHRAVVNVRRERQIPFRRWLYTAGIVSIIFLVCQTIGLRALIEMHAVNLSETKQFGLIFFLVLVHALHVVGGMTFLSGVIMRARHDTYDHEKHWTVDICAIYWHFLDVVWLAMLGIFFWAH